jgi:hypothetical protein
MGKYDVIDSKGLRNYMIGDTLEFKFGDKIPVTAKLLKRKTINSYLTLDENKILMFIGFIRSSDNRPPKKYFVDEENGEIYYIQKDYSNSFHVGCYPFDYDYLKKIEGYQKSEK